MNKFWISSSGTYKIDPESLHIFLGERGYRTYKPFGVKTTILVKIENNIVREVSILEIWELCWKYINEEYQFTSNEERRQVKDIFQRSRSLFHKHNLSLLKCIDLKECKDTNDKSYLFFKDYVLEITADSIFIKKYNEIEGFVFESDICDFNFDNYTADEQKILEPWDYNPFLPDDQGNLEPPEENGEFYEFILDLCKNDNKVINKSSYESLITIIGYLIHRYKDPANAKAIILMDMYTDGNANGGTGKSLLTKSLEYVRETAFQDGKYFTSSDKFVFSHITYGTRILVIDDVPRNFDFEKIFPLITEKAVIERKYENKVVIPFAESPKIVITTNYTVEGAGSSHSRRKVEFILAKTYNLDFSPEDKFGHLFFNEWNEYQWWEFYNFMIHCLQQFLKKGIVMPKFNVAERKLKMEASKEFIEYANHYIEPGVKHNKKTVYDDFYTKNQNHHLIELTTFRNWLKYFADAYGFSFFESHSGNDNFFEFS